MLLRLLHLVSERIAGTRSTTPPWGKITLEFTPGFFCFYFAEIGLALNQDMRRSLNRGSVLYMLRSLEISYTLVEALSGTSSLRIQPFDEGHPGYLRIHDLVARAPFE